MDPEMSEDYTVYCDSNRLEEYLQEHGGQEDFLSTQEGEPLNLITGHQRAGHVRRACVKSANNVKYDINDFEGELCTLSIICVQFSRLSLVCFII